MCGPLIVVVYFNVSIGVSYTKVRKYPKLLTDNLSVKFTSGLQPLVRVTPLHSGADANVVSRRVIDDLVELQSDVRLEPLAVPQEVEMYDGRVTVCTEEAHLDLRINTAAGPVNLYQVPCTVLDADTDEFLLGKITLRSLGIDMGRMIEQLAAAPNLGD
ncbi:hypothetical protein ON010_g7155 [Phytophthora cinnamomi]|nr:hypothetical protein ON010_g7155 [Phytophthora cinnamomi]